MAWIIQRATAVYLGLFLGYLLIHFTVAPPADHAALKSWAAQPLVSAGLLLFTPVLIAHAWVGIRDVLIDYVHPLGARVSLLTLFAFVFLASGLWALKAIIAAGLRA
jgi:succinate dehydrogenase / fumarate reductase membrane anchor subunit